MVPASKSAIVIAAVSKTNGATASGTVDCQGFNYLTLPVVLSASDDTASDNPSVLKLSESDDLTTYADIAACVGDGSGGFVIPAPKTADSVVAKFCVDLRPRKRYLKLTVSPTTTQTVVAVAELQKGGILPTDKTAAGADVLVEA